MYVIFASRVLQNLFFTLSKLLKLLLKQILIFMQSKLFFSITINWIRIQLTDGVGPCPIALRNWHLLWRQPLCRWIFLPSSLGRYLPNLWVLAQTWPPRKLFLLIRQGPRGLSKWTVFVEGFVLDFRAAALGYHFIMETMYHMKTWTWAFLKCNFVTLK